MDICHWEVKNTPWPMESLPKFPQNGRVMVPECSHSHDNNDWYETVKINYGVRPDGTVDFDTAPSEF